MVQKWPYFHLFFFGNIGQENVFCDIVERKNGFLGYKNNKFLRSKNLNFSKRVTHGFGPKMTVFPPFFLGNIVQENIFDDILKQKNAFLGYKKKKFRKSKNWYFYKGVNPWFLVQKWPFFQHLFLGNIGQQHVFYDNLERKNAFLGYKNKNFKKSKNWHFSKGVNPWF